MGDESIGPFGDDQTTWSNAESADRPDVPSEPSDDELGDIHDPLSADLSGLDDLDDDLDGVEDTGRFADLDAPTPAGESLDEAEGMAGVPDSGSDAADGAIDLTRGSEDLHQGLVGLDDFVEELGVDPLALDALSRSFDPDGFLGARPVAVALEQLGVGVALEHGDVDRLAMMLETGAEIRLGTFGIVTELDDLRDEVVVRQPDGARTRLALGLLEDAWGEHTYEMLVAGSPAGARVLLAVDLPVVDPSGGIT